MYLLNCTSCRKAVLASGGAKVVKSVQYSVAEFRFYTAYLTNA